MIDIHTHILYGIDDGASNIDESIEIIKNLQKIGFQKIIATPHYIENTEYTANNKIKRERLNKLNKELKVAKIDVELYLGNEIYINEDILKRLSENKISSMNNGHYLLIEIPLIEKIEHALDMLTNIKSLGYHIILAHPERYYLFQENPNMLEEYIHAGILLQGNISSLGGRYGKQAKKLCKRLLKKRKYFALASDIHKSQSHFFSNFERLKKKVIRLTGKEYFNQLFIENPERVLTSENI